MTSKSLYWAKWKENIKRRGWTFVLCFAAMFLLLPVWNLIELTSLQNAVDKAAGYGITGQELIEQRLYMQSRFAENVGFSEIFALAAAFFAILFAVQGFSFLYDRRKMDLYMSVPVSGPKRYVLIWGNGIVMFAVCYLPNLLLSWCVGAVFHVMNAELMSCSLLAFLVNLLAFTAMYQVALLAVMLTGNVLTALLGCCVLFLYEYAGRLLLSTLKSQFFVSYCRADDSRLMNAPWLSPFTGYLNLCSRIWYRGGSIIGYSGDFKWCPYLGTEALMLLLAAVVSGFLVYFLFRKRKTESYHRAIAFPAVKPALEFLMLVPFSVAVGLIVSGFTDDRNFFLFAGAVCAVLIGHALIQLIYERELKAAVGRKILLAVCMASAVILLGVFRFDLTGFDSYIPQKEKVASICVTLENDYSNFGRSNLTQRNGGWITAADDLLEHMNSTKPETIDAALEMVSAWQAAQMPDNSGREAATDNAEAQKSDAWVETKCFVVRYNLTNGRSVYRRFYADGNVTPDALNTLMQDPSYQKIRYQINSGEFEQAVNQMKIVYHNGKTEYLYTLDAQRLLETYRREFAAYDYQMISGQLPCGILKFTLPSENGSRYIDDVWTYPVYGEFQDTVALLCENGIDAGQRESLLAAEDVREITVTYYYYDGAAYEDGNALFEPGEIEEQQIVCTFDDPQQIAEILKALYSDDLAQVAGEEFKSIGRDYRFNVGITLSSEAVAKRYQIPYLFFMKGKTPAFVEKSIREAAVRG
ncbi:MAG: DUF6449 domain-containing protein [Eubacteriales bacterium]|nr:DUF6449 domain-containing protein [Eubacteriales bacterium]